MEAKIEHLKKLLTYHNQHVYSMPSGPGSATIEREIVARMKQPDKTVDRDDVVMSLDVRKPDTIAIHTCMISGHNGDEYDKYHEEIPLFEAFLDFAIAHERNTVHGYIERELMEEERRRMQARVEARMKELGL